MKLNSLSPAAGSTHYPKRVGRGSGSGLGKTCGRGHKGQKARSGGYHKVGFEGGQMPLQRRLPKVGFTAHKSLFAAKLRLSTLSQLDAEEITLASLKEAGLVAPTTKQVKIYLSGEINRAVKVKGIAVSKGAKEAIVAQGGTVEAE